MQKVTGDTRSSKDLTGQGVVLLVEDEAPVRRFAARALENKGYSVLQAENAEEALALLQKHIGPIDLVITDVVMPGMDGQQLAIALRALVPGLRCVFTSGYTSKLVAESGDIGPHFLQKPFSARALADVDNRDIDRVTAFYRFHCVTSLAEPLAPMRS